MDSTESRVSAASRAKMKYNAKAYDRLAIIVPKGKKELIAQHAERQGESLNGFVNRAIEEAMTRDAEAPPKKD